MKKKTALILSTILVTNSVFAYNNIVLQEKQGVNNTKLALEDDGFGDLNALLNGDLNLDENDTTDNSSDNQTTQTHSTAATDNSTNTNQTNTDTQNNNSNEDDPISSLNSLFGGDLNLNDTTDNSSDNQTNDNQGNTSNVNLGPKSNSNKNELEELNSKTKKELCTKKFLYLIQVKESKERLNPSTVKKLDEVVEKLPLEKIKNIVKNASKLDLKKSKYRYIIQYLASKSALKIIKLKLEKQHLTENLAKAKEELENYALNDDSINTIDPTKIENNIEKNIKKLPDYAVKCTYEELVKKYKKAKLSGLNKILVDYIIARTGLENIERQSKK